MDEIATMKNIKNSGEKMDWKTKRVLVTGASGFIGSYLVQALVDGGADVVALVRDDVPDSMYARLFMGNAITIHGDMEQYAIVERAINEYEIEYVFHLGAQTIVKIANASPLSTFKSNIEGTWNVLEAVRQHDEHVKATVIASSDKAYGEHEKLPYVEDMPLQPSAPYDTSKACADMLARTYAHTYGLRIGISRCGNVFGGGDLNFSRIVPGTIRSLYFNERPVIRSDGTYVRDYVYVKDVVQHYIRLLEKTDEMKLRGDVFNCSYGNPLSVLDIVAKIAQRMKKNISPDIRNTASNEIKKQYLDARKARTVLGWKPAYTLEKGLDETIEWYEKFLGNRGPWKS